METLLVPERKEFHAHHAHYLDDLMREYAKAAELFEKVRASCWEIVERAKNEGRDYRSLATAVTLAYPMLAQDIADFVEDLESV